jgi:hypothetical protein
VADGKARRSGASEETVPQLSCGTRRTLLFLCHADRRLMWLMKKYGFYIHLDRVRGQECALVQIFPRRYKNQAEKKSERWALQLPLLTALARTRPAIRLSSHSWASMHNADVRRTRTRSGVCATMPKACVKSRAVSGGRWNLFVMCFHAADSRLTRNSFRCCSACQRSYCVC